MIKKSRQGFTLAEALITLVIMSLVIAATIPIVRTASNQPAEAPWKYIVRGNLINNNATYTAPENNALSVIGDSKIPYDDRINEGDLPTIFASQINPKLAIITQTGKAANPVISRHLIDFYEKSGTNKHKSIGKISFDQNFNLALGANTLDRTVREATADVLSPNDTTKWCELGDNAQGAANTAVGQYAMSGSKKAVEKDTSNSYRTITGVGNTALGAVAMQNITSGSWNIAIGPNSLKNLTTDNVNIAIGAESMKNMKKPASTNIAIGVSALLGNETDANTQPIDNVVVGHYAMQNNIKGNNNVAIGNYVLNSNTEGQYNVAIGKDAMRAGTAVHNTVAVGYGALRYNTAEGIDNTAIGYQSLFANVSGSSNTAVGNFSLQGNKSGKLNTAMGYYALAKNTEGIQNSAFGSDALSSNTTGVFNTAVGSFVLKDNTTGTYNTAVGISALGANTVGKYSTAVGAYALGSSNRTDTNAGYNTAVGYQALQNSNNNLCTGVGVQALQYNTGTYNTALGAYAMGGSSSKYVTGGYNIGIGPEAIRYGQGTHNIAIGYKALQNSTGNYNIAIGENAGASNTSGSYKLYIGHGTSPIISGDMTTGHVTIAGDLTVSGTINNLTSSDARLKNILGDNTAGLKEINQLKVKNYTFKNDKEKIPHVGVIAQELQKVFPNSVFQDKRSKYLKITREEIFWACVNAIKELSEKIQDVIAKVTGLDEKIKLLEARNKMNEDKITNLEHQNKLYEERLQAIEFQIAKQLENNTKTQNKLEDVKDE